MHPGFIAVAAALLGVALNGCATSPTSSDPAAFTPPPAGPSRAPAAVKHGALSTLAEPQGSRLALHTVSGDVTFWTGVNLGSTTPGHNPGELAVDRATYRRWFRRMGGLGVQVLRTYAIHPPQMYEELLSFNQAHPKSPIYLMQGVYLPDESYTDTRDLYAPGPTKAFSEELRAASDAVHGTLRRPATRGRASGRWSADVSPWVAGWIIGVEWDPRSISASDRLNAGAPDFHGKFFSSVSDTTETTPTERWIAARMNELATAETTKGRSALMAFVNWPTTDPLRHPQEPLAQEEHAPRHAAAQSERRALWHDPLTNEQWFGLNAVDPTPAGTRVLAEARTGVQQIAPSATFEKVSGT